MSTNKVFKDLAESVLHQHQEVCERVIRDMADSLEARGVWVPGTPLHDHITTSSLMHNGGPRTLISYNRPGRQPAPDVVVTTRLLGNAWTTEVWSAYRGRALEPEPQPLSGGSALYGSPQDATQNKIRQPPSSKGPLLPEGRPASLPPVDLSGADDTKPRCSRCRAPLPRWSCTAEDCSCNGFPGAGVG